MKERRQRQILELINSGVIETQEELLERLKSGGVDVTQATISRDIRELKISKVVTADGISKYAAAQAQDLAADPVVSERFRRHFREGVVSMDYAGNMLVIKTMSGMAMGVAAALDQLNKRDIMGCIAGDDTVFAVMRSFANADSVIDQLRNI
ncbi:MAG: arginine repressor [Defluviitaleaceae bacterium]|nr:arginine repressor [Defluviitaleaceae bacterium]